MLILGSEQCHFTISPPPLLLGDLGGLILYASVRGGWADLYSSSGGRTHEHAHTLSPSS